MTPGTTYLKKIQNKEFDKAIGEELNWTNGKGISMGETVEMINKHLKR